MSGFFFESNSILSLNDSSKGILTVINLNQGDEITPRRVYIIHSVKKSTIRGYHAHHNLKQLVICTQGKIKIALDDGIIKNEYELDNPNKALYIAPLIWHTMEWLENDSVLVVLASELYDENDYIRDYNDFKEKVKVHEINTI